MINRWGIAIFTLAAASTAPAKNNGLPQLDITSVDTAC